MRAEVILTTWKNGELVEEVVGYTNVTQYTNYRELVDALGKKQFGPDHRVRIDSSLFGYVAANGNGDTVHIR